jgi:hypothetical protein
VELIFLLIECLGGLTREENEAELEEEKKTQKFDENKNRNDFNRLFRRERCLVTSFCVFSYLPTNL